MSEKIIEMQNVNKWFDDFHVLKDVNLEFEGWKMTALVGHSVSGKSTILNLIPRFYHSDLGEIKIDNDVSG